ncbi:MAG: DPP IV N-terminal domain-containing protein [Chloroflexota bacterium]
MKKIFISIMLLAVLLTGCGTSPAVTDTQPSSDSAVVPAVQSATETPAPTETALPTETPAPTFTPMPTAVGGGGNFIVYHESKKVEGTKEDTINNIFRIDLSNLSADPVQLTDASEKNVSYTEPVFSPDGSKIVLVKVTKTDSELSYKHELFLMDPDGKNMVQLSPIPENTGKRNLNDLLSDWDPYWSPDGKQIVFASNRANIYARANQIFIINVETKELTQLTTANGDSSGPAWSPDGKTIAFMSDRSGNYEIYTMDTNGKELKQLTKNPKSDRFPRWAPDGTKLIFHSDRAGSYDLYTLDLASSEVLPLTNGAAKEATARYSTDGSWIVYQSNQDGDYEIFIMKSDGTEPQQLTHNDADDVWASWSSAKP